MVVRATKGALGIRDNDEDNYGETSFSLAYGMEVILPVEVNLPISRVAHFNEEKNKELIGLELDLQEEILIDSQLRLAAYQRRTIRYYNKRVKQRGFNVEELILRREMQNTKTKNSDRNPRWRSNQAYLERRTPQEVLRLDISS